MATFTATNSLDLVGSQVITGGLTIGNIAQGAEVVDGLKVTTGGVTIDSGGLTVTAGGATVTAGGLTVNSGAATVPYLSVTGLSSDVNSGARFVGATSGAAPQGGTYAIGDYVIGRNGTLWICTIAGSPGTWQQVSGGGNVTYGTPIAVTYGATAFQGNAASAARSDHVHSTADIPSLSQNNTFSGNITVSGNLTINSTATTIVDPIIDIGGAANGAAPSSDDAKDRGISFQWHNGTAAKLGFFGWDRSAQRFSVFSDATITGEVVSGTKGSVDVSRVFLDTGLVIDSLNGIAAVGSAGDHKAYLGFMSPGNNNWTTTDLVYTYENGSSRTVPYLSRTSTWTATQTFSNATYSALFTGGNVGIGTATPGSPLDVKGTIRLSGSTSGYVGLAPAAIAGSTTYTLPSADGTSGQVLSTNGSGVMSWVTSGTTTQPLTIGSNLTGTSFNGSSAVTIALSATPTSLTSINGISIVGSGSFVTTGDTGTVTNTMLAGSIANAKLVNSSITVNSTAIALGGSGTITAANPNALTISTGLSGTSYDGSSAVTISLNLGNANTWTATQTFSNATSAIFGSGDGTGTITGGLLRAPSGTGTNIAGGSLTIAGGASTGTGAGGAIIFQTADAGITSGSSVNSLTERIRINESGVLISQRFGDVLAANASFTGGAWKYINSNPAWLMGGYAGDSTVFRLYTFPSGTAGASISTWNLSIAIPALTGYVGINTSTPSQWLEVYGKIASRPASTQDAIIISGRAGGVSSYAITLTPATLTTNQAIVFPNSSGTVALQSDTTYIGTTAVTLSRASANLALTGISSVNGITVSGSSGTFALQGDTHYIGTTAVTLNRASANLALTGITSVNGITVSGSSGTFALQGDTQYIGTTAVTLNRASANLALTGISSVTLPGSTSGTIQIVPSAVAGTNTQFTLPATSGTAITSGDTGTVTNTMLAGSIANAKLTNSSVTVNGTAIALGASGTVTATASNALTIGSGLSGSSYNGSSPVTISLNTANANTWTATQTFADINVTGTLSVVQTLITAIENPTIDLGGLTGGGAPTSDDNKDRGFTFQWHNGTSAKKGFLGYTDSTSVLSFIPDATETSGVYSGTYGVAKFGGIQLNLSSVSANTTLDSTYSYVLATGTITVTLPTAVGITGRLYWIKKMDTGTTLTIATTSSQTIDGSSTLTVNTQYASYTVVSNGSNWIIV